MRRRAETENGGLKQGELPSKGPGSFRAMPPGNCGNLGNIGNVESVTCRPHYPEDGTNPPLSAPLKINGLHVMQRGIEANNAEMA